MPVLMKQEQVNELVDRFYTRLAKDPYYTQMFSERKVDIHVLKERQRAFIARLANSEDNEQDNVQQVQKRHGFQVKPERAKVWLNHMKLTLDEMDLDPEVKGSLLQKIQFLTNKMTDKLSTEGVGRQ